MLTSYTLSKLLTSSENSQTEAYAWTGAGGGAISPYERRRNKSLASDDVPQILSVAFVYELPFGKKKRWLSGQHGIFEKLAGGWEISSIFRASSGTPFFFRSSNCNLPSQLRAACIPAILPGANPLAQPKEHFDPDNPLFNAAAFEDPNRFNFYYGQGARVSNVRGFGYHNQDLGLAKNTRITEKVVFQIRAEFFNLWNWHIFSVRNMIPPIGPFFNPLPFDSDVSSPSFGRWNGNVSAPRNIQVAARITF